jgi:hypothetical protein
MKTEKRNALDKEASATLRANDRGGYTLPTAGLYPFQWDWDAAVTAIGWLTFNEPRAWDEFRWLLKGQWVSGPQAGLLPHIVFHQPSESYFPGPAEWGLAHLRPPTSSISQPPLHATLLRWMWQRAKDRDLAARRLREIVPAIAAHHRWWYRTRDPAGTGLVLTVHPWETGRDNAPSWDDALARVPRATRPYRRRDIDHVDAAQRPTQAFYDRVVYLMDFMRDAAFDPATIARDCPFRVVDVCIVFILHRATRDLLALAQDLSLDVDAASLAESMARTERAIGDLWSERLGMFVCRDLVNGALIEQPTMAGFLSWYAGLGSPHQQRRQATSLRAWLDEVHYGVPSTRASAAAFEPRRYWRGPVWQHMNMLIETGLREQGEPTLAGRIRRSSLELFDRSGFHEYYDPMTGEGLGGTRFSWTAATWLYWFG